MRQILLPLLFSLLLIGCGSKDHYPTADSLCDVNPKAAIDSLDGMEEQMTQASEADQMYYQLLRIKAADKAYIPHTSDSLIRTVLDYYEHGGDPQLLPTAYYYGGRVSMDLGDAPQTIGYYRKALDAMPHDSTTARLRGLCHNQMGHLYSVNTNRRKNVLRKSVTRCVPSMLCPEYLLPITFSMNGKGLWIRSRWLFV